MKATLRFSMVIFFAASILMINGCKKGADGAPGKDGSANVKARTFPVSPWQSNSSRWYTQLSVPEITSDNINSAGIQVYIGTASNTWLAIPYTYMASTNYFWGFVTTVNSVEVRWEYNGIGIGSDPNTIYGATVQVKVVIIPPAMIKPNVNHQNYAEVKSAYKLKD
jgi:hypothetical protein